MVQVVKDWRDLPEDLRGAAVAIGAFDGVHRGHQAVISAAREAAQALDAPLAVVSFAPHPRRWFQPEAAPFRLMTTDQMARALAPLGVERLYLLPFDAEMAMSPSPLAGGNLPLSTRANEIAPRGPIQ